MKHLRLTALLFAGLLPVILGSCLFKEPVFTSGFGGTDASLIGVWGAEDELDDMEKAELAALLKIDDAKYLLHYPAREKDGIYYPAQPLTLRGRLILQIQALGTLKQPLIKPGAGEVYTLVWIEKQGDGRLSIRPLNGKMEKVGPEATRKKLEDAATDWSELFVEPKVFKRVRA